MQKHCRWAILSHEEIVCFQGHLAHAKYKTSECNAVIPACRCCASNEWLN